MNAPEARSSSEKSLARRYLLDSICDSFEAAWKEGSEPRIEDYLSSAEEEHARELFEELIHVDMYYRRRNGESSTIDDYIVRFPQYSSDLTLPRQAPDAASKPADSIPTTRQIGDYELRDQIGAGSFGTVWRAWHPQLHRMDAIKLPQHGINDREQMDVLHHEARAAARLNHPNVVHVIGFGEWSQQPYIVFEFIQGITLKQWRKKESHSVRAITELVIKLADGIHHAHELKIVHRDLKPQNILVDEDGEPHITDFGMAKRLDIHSTIAVDGVIMGTVPYMSPEQVAADHQLIEPASDIYSLGVILYELLTNSLPFEGSRQKMMNDIQYRAAPSLCRRNPDIPRDLETVCLKALQKQPADRFASAADFRDDLRRSLDGTPIHARRVTIASQALRWCSRHSYLLMGVLILITAVLMVVEFPGERPHGPSADVQHAPRKVRVESIPDGATVVIYPFDPNQSWLRPGPVVYGQTPFECELEPGEYLLEAQKGDQTAVMNAIVPDDGSKFRWGAMRLMKRPGTNPPQN